MIPNDPDQAAPQLAPSVDVPGMLEAYWEGLAKPEAAAGGARPVDLAEQPEQVRRLAGVLEELKATVQSLRADIRETSEPGTQPLGDFQIVREIARGGMGIVYEARQLSLNRRVALKVLPFAAGLDRRALERFRNEAQAAARLDHPHIVHVYGVGCDRGVHYYAMQYIEGQSLAEVISEMRGAEGVKGVEKSMGSKSEVEFGVRNSECGIAGTANSSHAIPNSELRIPDSPNPKSQTPNPKSGTTLALRAAGLSTDRADNPKEHYRTVARLGIQVAEALDYAHSQGVLHRDVKPGNLLLDDTGDIWIADFGLARIGDEGNLTRTGDMVGTLRYASPEQILAQRGLVDQRTDIYSLGATLYELLTLRPVFHEEDRKQLLKQITDADPQMLRKIDSSIPSELEMIVLKCLEKEPADRYATAGEMAADLKHYLAYEPLVVRRAGLFERLVKWSRRHQPWVLAILATTTLATLFLAGSTAWVVHERDQTARERETAGTQRALATARQDALREHAYINSIHGADTAWRRGDFSEARRLLDGCRPQPGEEDMRGFEWHLLARIAGEVPSVWRRHEGDCYCARFSPDGKLLATSGKDGVRVWTWPAGDRVAHLTQHNGDVNCVAFSPDGKLLATASDDRSVKMFDTQTWQEVRTIPHPFGEVVGVVFSPDGMLLYSVEKYDAGKYDAGPNWKGELLHCWRVADGTEQKAIGGTVRDEVQEIAISSDGRFVGLASGTGCACFWGVETSAKHDAPTVSISHGCCMRSIAFAHHHPLWAASDTRGVVAVYNISQGRVENHFKAHNSWVESVSFCSQDDALVSAGGEGTIRLWEFTAAGSQMFNSTTYRGVSSPWCAVFSPDGGTIVATRRSGEITLLRRDHPTEYQSFVVPWKDSTAIPITFSPDGRKLDLGGDGVSLIDFDTADPPVRVINLEEPVNNVIYSPDGKVLVTGTSANRVETWDTTSWSRTATLRDGPSTAPRNSGASCLVFRETDGARLIEDLRVHPARLVHDRRGNRGAPWFVAFQGRSVLSFSGDGRLMACSGAWPYLDMHVYDAASESPVFSPNGRFASVALSRDGLLFAAGGDAGSVTIWKTNAWDEPLVTSGHPVRVGSLDFSPDGHTLASAADDGSIKLWHVPTGQELVALNGHSRTAQILTFSPDGGTLASSGVENTADGRHEIHLWRIDGGDDAHRDE